MAKIKVGLVDKSFAHQTGLCKYHDPFLVEWDRSGITTDIVFFTDLCFSYAALPYYDKSFKVAMLIEPPEIMDGTYKFIKQYYSLFNVVLTYNKALLAEIPNGKYYPNGMCWVAKSDFDLHKKTKDLSIIVSNKNYAIGHKLRHTLINNGLTADVYGSGYKPIEHKIEALKDYRFSLAIENCICDTYFTEKLLDCFVTGTIPIYYGTNKVLDIFNPAGIVYIPPNLDIQSMLDLIHVSVKNFHVNDEVLKDNLKRAQEFIIPDDWIIKRKNDILHT